MTAGSEARSTSSVAPWWATAGSPASRSRPGSEGTAIVPPRARIPDISRRPAARSAFVGIAWLARKPLTSTASCAMTSAAAAAATHRPASPARQPAIRARASRSAP